MTSTAPEDPETSQLWHRLLTHGHAGRWAFLPSEPRCMVCRQPFRGVGGRLLRAFTGSHASRMSLNMCNRCEDRMPPGGVDVDVAVLFADIRGSTAMSVDLNSREYAARLERFYEATSHVLIAAQSWIDNLIGDEIMALYIPAMGADYRRRAVIAGAQLLEAVGYHSGQEPWITVGVGVHAGQAFVGKVGVAGGELLIGEGRYESVRDLYPDIERRDTVRGKDEPVAARVLRPREW